MLQVAGDKIPTPSGSLKALLVAYNGEFLVERFIALGIINMQTFAIMAALRHRDRSFALLFQLAVGVGRNRQSARCLELLMDRQVVQTISDYDHHSGASHTACISQDSCLLRFQTPFAFCTMPTCGFKLESGFGPS